MNDNRFTMASLILISFLLISIPAMGHSPLPLFFEIDEPNHMAQSGDEIEDGPAVFEYSSEDDDEGSIEIVQGDATGGGCFGAIGSINKDKPNPEYAPCPAPEIMIHVSDVRIAAGLPVSFRGIVNSRQGCPVTSVRWDFGDGSATEYGYLSDHVFKHPGNYEIIFEVENATGTFKTRGRISVICPSPDASFINSKKLAKPGEVILFEDTSRTHDQCPVIFWNWDFGDGAVASSNPEPTHNYEYPGQYSVTLTASNEGGPDTVRMDDLITVRCDTVIPDFEASAYQGTAPFVVNFKDTTVTDALCHIEYWYWEFGDNTTSTDQNPTHTFDKPGSWDVTMTVVTSDGLEWSVTKPAMLNCLCPPPVPDFTSDATSGPVPLSVKFADTSITLPECPVSRYNWDLGDGTIIQGVKNPHHTYLNIGNMDVSLEVFNEGGSAIITIPNAVSISCDLPSADFSADRVMGLSPMLVQFADLTTFTTGCSAQAYHWNFGDGSVSTEANPVHQYSSPGIYTVELNVTNSAGASREIKTDYISVK